MARYPPPKFHGLAGEDPADYIRDLRQWCEASPNHDPNAGHQHRIRIDGLFESGLLDYAKDWYETEIKGRNWELQNISDNTGLANIGAINGLANNNALRAINANQFRGGALHIRNTVPADNNAIANPLVLGHTVWEEDWSISGGRPTHLAPNAPNANASEVRRIGLETPLPGLIKKLEEIERYSAQQILGTTLHQPSHKTNSQGSTSAEIEKLKSEIASLRTQLAQPAQVHTQNNEALEKMYIRAVRLGMPPDAPRDLTSLDNYINDELIRRLGVANANYAKLSKQINAVKKLHKSGHKPIRKKKVKKGHSPITSSQKKKSKTRKSRKVKDAETPPLADPSGIASVPISEKVKQSSKSPTQDEQSRLEKIIEKIIEKVLNEKFGTITALLHPQNDNSKTLADSEEDEFIDVPMEIDF
ncbi:unnamed protein product [Rhizophagus irregularis]|nr:unnamed protein product [Rhizophagus irregularis]